MTALIWVVATLIVVALVAVGARAAGRRALTGVDPTQLSLDPALIESVRRTALSGRQVQAITQLREATGMSLVSAKAMVDKMVAGAAGSPDRTVAPGSTAPPSRTRVEPIEAAPSRSPLPLEVELRARALKADGQANQAITLVAEHTGLDPLECQALVDAL